MPLPVRAVIGITRTAEFGAEFFHVNADAVAPGHVHHVQRHDDRAIQFQNLAGEKKIPFKIGRVHDHQRRVRRGVSFQPSTQCVAGQFFFRRGAFQTVKPRQIHEDNLLVADFGSADAAFDGGAGKIRGLGAQAGQRVEQRGLAGIGIANQRKCEGVMRQVMRLCRLATDDAVRNFPASLMRNCLRAGRNGRAGRLPPGHGRRARRTGRVASRKHGG